MIAAISTSIINDRTEVNAPLQGPAIPADPLTDPQSMFNADTGLSMATDYEPVAYFRSLEVRGGADGQTAVTIKASYKNGGVTTHTVTLAAYEVVIINGWFRGIFKTGTTATLLFPFF
jgi:hypothetical protein